MIDPNPMSHVAVASPYLFASADGGTVFKAHMRQIWPTRGILAEEDTHRMRQKIFVAVAQRRRKSGAEETTKM